MQLFELYFFFLIPYFLINDIRYCVDDMSIKPVHIFLLGATTLVF